MTAEVRRHLTFEARALLTRLACVRPFALQVPMTVAAAVSPAAQQAIERTLLASRRRLRTLVGQYIRGLETTSMSDVEGQRGYALVKVQFDEVLSQVDIFADVLVQRGQHEVGAWLSGLDAVAADAMRLPGVPFAAPPAVCYLQRGFGAAIRRAHTRLPGGATNPIAVVQIPRERMVGTGISSSLLHELGHQAEDLLGIVRACREVLRMELQRRRGRPDADAWTLYERWISEIIADLWPVSFLGVSATAGLINVITLPRAFMFQIDPEDPHPFPWFRARLSAALGQRLYPDPHWARLMAVWNRLYPTTGLGGATRALIGRLLAALPEFIETLLFVRPPSFRGRTIGQVMLQPARAPARLRSLGARWGNRLAAMASAAPSLALAVIGQQRVDGRISPEQEARLIGRLLEHWALISTFAPTARTAAGPKSAGSTVQSARMGFIERKSRCLLARGVA